MDWKYIAMATKKLQKKKKKIKQTIPRCHQRCRKSMADDDSYGQEKMEGFGIGLRPIVDEKRSIGIVWE